MEVRDEPDEYRSGIEDSGRGAAGSPDFEGRESLSCAPRDRKQVRNGRIPQQYFLHSAVALLLTLRMKLVQHKRGTRWRWAQAPETRSSPIFPPSADPLDA